MTQLKNQVSKINYKSNYIVGTKQVLREIQKNMLEKSFLTNIYIAKDADEFIKNKIITQINKAKLSPEMLVNLEYNMHELGKLGNISIGAACIAIIKNN